MEKSIFTTLFLDIGGVILTNGWDHALRSKTARYFNIDFEEMNKRHALTFDTYEIGKITLDEYLERIVFYVPRSFSKEEFKAFIFSQSGSFHDMIALIEEVKRKYALKVVAVSNEGRELMEQRVHDFQLKKVIDFFICSGFVGLRKPDNDIYQLALDLAQVDVSEVIYIDDRPLLTEIMQKMGMEVIQHSEYEQTRNTLIQLLERRQ